MKSDSKIARLTEKGLKFEDGTELEADVIVLATGFETNMRLAASRIVGPVIGEQLDEWYGVDAEGEVRGLGKTIGRKLDPSWSNSIA